MSEFSIGGTTNDPEGEGGIDILPLIVRRFQVQIPLAGQPFTPEDAEDIGEITVPHAVIRVPTLDTPAARYAGVRYDIFPLPGRGDGWYEIVVVYALWTDGHLEEFERARLAGMVNRLEELEENDGS